MGLENILKRDDVPEDVKEEIRKNISERDKTELQCKENEFKFRTVADFTFDWEYWEAENKSLIYMSPSCERITGYSPKEFISNPKLLTSIIIKDGNLYQKHFDKVHSIENRNIIEELVFRLIKKDGSIAYVEHLCRPVFDDNNNYLGRRISNRDITDCKLAEEALRESEIQFRTLFEKANDGIMYISPKAEIINVNESFARMHGYTVEEILNIKLQDLDVEYHPKIFSERKQRITDGEKFRFEVKHYHKNGHIIDLEVSTCMISRNNKNFFIAFHRDITERKKLEDINISRLHLLRFSISHNVEELLEETLNELERLTGSLIGFYHFLEADQKTLSLQNWSSQTKEKFCKAEGKGQHYSISEAGVWVDCIYERKPVIHNDYASLSNRKGFPVGHAPVIRELVVPVMRDEKIVAILGIGNKPTNYTNADVEMVSLLADMTWDMTERKRTEEELRKSEERFKVYTEFSPVSIYVTDKFGKCVYINSRWKEQSGLTTEEANGDGWINGLHIEDRKLIMESWNKMIESNGKWSLQYRFVNKKGIITWVSGSVVKIYDSNGQLSGYLGTNTDITERKRTEEALKESEQKYRDIVEGTDNLISVVDPVGKIIYVNYKTKDIWGLPADECLGMNTFEFIHLEDIKRTQEWFTNTIKTKQTKGSIENRQISRTGKVFHTLWTCSFHYDKNGNISHINSIARDITERKQTEELRLRVEKLESLGNLAGGVAHEFNNVLTSIFGFIEVAKDESTDENVINKLDKALNSMSRAKNLTRQLITFAKGGEPVRKTEQIRPVIQDMAQSLLKGSNLSCQFDFSDTLWSVSFDKNQIDQVIFNIIINAKEAMPSGGTIEISARNITHEKHENAVLSEGNFVKISFKDNGIGISNDILTRIFDPFFTTDLGKSGLGLAICHSIIKRHDGIIEVESEVGKGSTFHIYLPAII